MILLSHQNRFSPESYNLKDAYVSQALDALIKINEGEIEYTAPSYRYSKPF